MSNKKCSLKEKVDYIKYYYHNICNSLHIYDEAKILFITTHKVASSCIKDKISQETHHVDKECNWRMWVDSLTEDILSEYFIFTFSRNPWDRMVSIANHFSLSLEKAIGLANTRKHTEGFYTHSLPCSYSSHDKNLKQVVDFVGRFENIDEDFDIIAKKTGLSGRIERKKSKKPHYSTMYNERLIDGVRKKYANDIKLFGYEFENCK
jgi:hypothetical protein